MHESALLAIWFLLNIAGMVMTMFLSHLFTKRSGYGVKPEQAIEVSSEDRGYGEGVVMAQMGKAA